MDKPTDAATVEVVQERIRVDTLRKEVGALRLHIESEEHDSPLTLDRMVENVVVERVEVNRQVAQREEPWYDNGALVVPIYAEIPVVARQLVMVAEVRLRREVTQSSTTSTVTLTRQRAVVERRKPDGSWVEVDPVTRSA